MSPVHVKFPSCCLQLKHLGLVGLVCQFLAYLEKNIFIFNKYVGHENKSFLWFYGKYR